MHVVNRYPTAIQLQSKPESPENNSGLWSSVKQTPARRWTRSSAVLSSHRTSTSSCYPSILFLLTLSMREWLRESSERVRAKGGCGPVDNLRKFVRTGILFSLTAAESFSPARLSSFLIILIALHTLPLLHLLFISSSVLHPSTHPSLPPPADSGVVRSSSE